MPRSPSGEALSRECTGGCVMAVQIIEDSDDLLAHDRNSRPPMKSRMGIAEYVMVGRLLRMYCYSAIQIPESQ